MKKYIKNSEFVKFPRVIDPKMITTNYRLAYETFTQ